MHTYDQVTSSLRQAYDGSAAVRDATAISAWKMAEVEEFLAYLRKEGKADLLEIGAGPGIYGRFFQDQGLRVTCTDLSPEMVRLCREKGLEAQVMDFLHLDFAEASFDAVFALNCLLHVPSADLPDVLAVIRRLLRPTGLFYMGVYGGEFREGVWEQDYHNPQRFFVFYPDADLLRIVMTHFELVYFRHVPQKERSIHFQSLILRKTV